MYGHAKYKELCKERYLITKHTNTSYSDTGNMTPVERRYIIEFIQEDFQRQQNIIENLSR